MQKDLQRVFKTNNRRVQPTLTISKVKPLETHGKSYREELKAAGERVYTCVHERSVVNRSEASDVAEKNSGHRRLSSWPSTFLDFSLLLRFRLLAYKQLTTTRSNVTYGPVSNACTERHTHRNAPPRDYALRESSLLRHRPHVTTDLYNARRRTLFLGHYVFIGNPRVNATFPFLTANHGY